jgi:succinoglycan biosynthesis protein ExoM
VTGPSRPAPTVSVCIATHRRPELLDELLSSLADQQLPPGASFEVVVVDNDYGASAAPVADRWRQRGLDLLYDLQPERNISITRNRSLALARADVLAIIDDDEVAGPQWMAALLSALERYRADVVLGPVRPRFEHPPPRWIAENPYFNLYLEPSGTPVETGGAGNCAFRRDVLALLGPDRDRPFDPALGRSGGEDTDLFERLHRKGARLVRCQEAWVEEHVPSERLRWQWLIRRAFRTGGGFSSRQVRLSSRPVVTATGLAVKASAVLVLSALRTTVARGPVERSAWALRTASAAGQLRGLVLPPRRGY